jgi:predicted nuclease of predicted toxin-antitoxin system
MRVLIDEDVNVRLRFYFEDRHHVETVEYRDWKGLRNGALLQTAADEFDVLVTMDNNLPDQQNLEEVDLFVIVLRPRSKRLDDLVDLMPSVHRTLDSLPKSTFKRITP